MIYPYVTLKYINENVGYGVFATQFIAKGTVIYCEDPLDQIITPLMLEGLPELYHSIVKRLAYVDDLGNYVLCWDIAKHMNHRCDCNTLSTAYGIDVALRDIQPGEELTDDYGLFNLEEEMTLSCGCQNCRKVLRQDDFEHLYPIWDNQIQEALRFLPVVNQPLQPFIEPNDWAEVWAYLEGNAPYRSVFSTRYSKRRLMHL